jgi:hypothetical protein
MTDNDVLLLLREIAEQLYFRAQASKYREERKAIKGVQHAIEDVVKRHGLETFKRPNEDLEKDDIVHIGLPLGEQSL